MKTPITTIKHGTNEIQQMLVLSTAHIPSLTAQWMQDPDTGITQGECQLMIYHDFDLEGKHPELQLLLKLAKELGCNYLMLDRDGPVNATLPTFEW